MPKYLILLFLVLSMIACEKDDSEDEATGPDCNNPTDDRSYRMSPTLRSYYPAQLNDSVSYIDSTGRVLTFIAEEADLQSNIHYWMDLTPRCPIQVIDGNEEETMTLKESGIPSLGMTVKITASYAPELFIFINQINTAKFTLPLENNNDPNKPIRRHDSITFNGRTFYDVYYDSTHQNIFYNSQYKLCAFELDIFGGKKIYRLQ